MPDNSTRKITVSVKSFSQVNAVLDALQHAENNGVIDFPLGVTVEVVQKVLDTTADDDSVVRNI